MADGSGHDDTIASAAVAPTVQSVDAASAETVASSSAAALDPLALPVVAAASYQRLDEYARGGLGRIIRATDQRTGRSVAIKEMLAHNADAAARFVREAMITANLQHPAIVPVYEVGQWSNGKPFYAMKLVSGRSFSNEFKGDSSGIILNETAVRQLGYEPQTAIGRKIYFSFANFQGDMHIVGVVKDFNFESLHNGIKPHGFTSNMFGNKYGYVVASLASTNYSRLIGDIEKVWAKLNPSVPFVYSFLDQDFQRNYEKEQRTSQIVVYFTIIAIFIACLGLFGLSAFAAEQRTKEIGVRKVLGASVASVTSLLSKDFIRLILIAIVIASPLAWYAMNQWLEDFAYRVTISWWMFAAAGLLAVVVAVITISFQSIKAAIANPVKSLRTE